MALAARDDAGTLPVPVLVLFPGRALQYHTGTRSPPQWQPRLVWSCPGLYVVFLTALELRQELWGPVLVAVVYCAGAQGDSQRGLTLLLVFMAMFIDVHLLTQLPALVGVFNQSWRTVSPDFANSLSACLRLSVMCPVPFLLLNYVPASTLLAWAVNIGGLIAVSQRAGKSLLFYGWRTIAESGGGLLTAADAGMGGAGGI